MLLHIKYQYCSIISQYYGGVVVFVQLLLPQQISIKKI